MTGFQFVPVDQLEGEPPLIIGLSGLSDSGKTYSALMIAKALAEMHGGFVAAGDTEGRMKKYADAEVYPELHPFRATRWLPPFNGDRAVELCKSAIEAGAGCIILDSATDEWEGDGGVLQSQEMHLARMAGDDFRKRDKLNMPAWAKAKAPHKRWHTYLLTMPVPIILCHRAREKIKMVKKGNKTEIVDAGVQPICDTRLVYDMMVHLLMDEEKRDGSYKVLKGGYKHERHVFPPGGKVDAAAIARLVASQTGKKPAPAPAPAAAPVSWILNEDGRYVYNGIGDPASTEAQRELFTLLKRELSAGGQYAAKIAQANAGHIAILPPQGKAAIMELIDALEDDEPGDDAGGLDLPDISGGEPAF